MKSFLATFFLVLFVVLLQTNSFSITEKEIDDLLMNLKSEDYSFISKNGTYWKVQYYGKTIHIYISPNKNNSNFDIIYVYSTVASFLSSEELSRKDLVNALFVNSSPSEWGALSLYKDDNNRWFLDYNIKLRKIYTDSKLLLNAIGYVSGSVGILQKEFE